MSQRAYDALFIDFYGTITSGDRRAVEEVSWRVVADLHLSLSAERFAIEWGKEFFAATDRRNHERFGTLFEIECDSLCATVAGLGVHDFDPILSLIHI